MYTQRWLYYKSHYWFISSCNVHFYVLLPPLQSHFICLVSLLSLSQTALFCKNAYNMPGNKKCDCCSLSFLSLCPRFCHRLQLWPSCPSAFTLQEAGNVVPSPDLHLESTFWVCTVTISALQDKVNNNYNWNKIKIAQLGPPSVLRQQNILTTAAQNLPKVLIGNEISPWLLYPIRMKASAVEPYALLILAHSNLCSWANQCLYIEKVSNP